MALLPYLSLQICCKSQSQTMPLLLWCRTQAQTGIRLGRGGCRLPLLKLLYLTFFHFHISRLARLLLRVLLIDRPKVSRGCRKSKSKYTRTSTLQRSLPGLSEDTHVHAKNAESGSSVRIAT